MLLYFLDPKSRGLFVTSPAINSIAKLLWNQTTSVVVDSLTTLLFIFGPDTERTILTPSNIAQIRLLSRSANPRISNVAHLFLEDNVPSQKTAIVSTK